MTSIAVIGGSGLTRLPGLEITHREVINTTYGEPSGAVTHGTLKGKAVVFLARHGNSHHIPPHEINYRANLSALKEIEVSNIIAFNAVGGITPPMQAAAIAIPDQIIDYTYGREHTYFDKEASEVVHIDFSFPYSDTIREALIQAARSSATEVVEKGVYGVTQGPRLETAAEILKLEKDGCDLVGMTGMPEAALARELGIDYASCCIVANLAAGKGEGIISMEQINQNLNDGMDAALKVLAGAIALL